MSAFSAYGDEIADLVSSAEAGDPQSQLALGWCYLDGQGVKQNKKLGFQWIKKAADQGYAPAECDLGYLYHIGRGTNTEFKRAFELYASAAEKGNPAAQNNLAVMYTKYTYSNHNPSKGFYWFKKAAEQNDPVAQRNLGDRYKYGWNVRKNSAEAEKWYALAAQKGVYPSIGESRFNLTYELSNNKKLVTSAPTQKNPPVPNASTIQPKESRITAKMPTETLKFSQNDINAMLNENVSKNDIRDRPRMTVRAFIDRTGEGKEAADAIMEMMVSELSKARLFNLIEREMFNEYIGEEIDLGQSGLIDPSTAPPIGKLKGLQYTMTGAITVLYYSEKASKIAIPILGIATQAKTAYVVIDIRILNNVTGEIVYASDQTGQAKRISGGLSVTDSRFFIGGYSKQIGGLLQEAARDAVKKHVSAIKKLKLEWL